MYFLFNFHFSSTPLLPKSKTQSQLKPSTSLLDNTKASVGDDDDHTLNDSSEFLSGAYSDYTQSDTEVSVLRRSL